MTEGQGLAKQPDKLIPCPVRRRSRGKQQVSCEAKTFPAR